MAKKMSKKVVENKKPTMEEIIVDISNRSQENRTRHSDDICMDFINDYNLDPSLRDNLVKLVKTEVSNSIETCLDYVEDQSGYICDAVNEENAKYSRVNDYNKDYSTAIDKAEDLADILRNFYSPALSFDVKNILGEFLK